jgi:hypothetical protein
MLQIQKTPLGVMVYGEELTHPRPADAVGYLAPVSPRDAEIWFRAGGTVGISRERVGLKCRYLTAWEAQTTNTTGGTVRTFEPDLRRFEDVVAAAALEEKFWPGTEVHILPWTGHKPRGRVRYSRVWFFSEGE